MSSILPRRSFVGKAAILAIFPFVGRARAAARPRHDEQLADPARWFHSGGRLHYLTVQNGQIVEVPRWNLDLPGEQPEPVETEVLRSDDHAVILRRWQAGDVDRCGLCRSCAATRHADGRGLCLVTAPATITDADAPLYSEEDA